MMPSLNVVLYLSIMFRWPTFWCSELSKISCVFKLLFSPLILSPWALLVGLRVATGPHRLYTFLTALLCLCKNPSVCEPLRASTTAYPPVIIQTAVEFGVAGEASVSKSRTAHTALQAALVVRDVDDSHDVAIADRTAADATQRHRHFTASTIFGHRQGPTENKNS